MASNMVEFAAWEPDQPVYGGNHATVARNVIPGKRGYRSFPGFAPLEKAALDGRVFEAFALRTLNNDLLTLASTSTGIYALQGNGWAQKYAAPTTLGRCDFANYGETIYALHGGKLVKAVTNAGIAEAFAEVEGAPAGRVLGVLKDFMVIGGLDDYGNGIRWSSIDNPDSWPTPGSNDASYAMSDIQIFPVGGNVKAIVGGVGSVDGLIFSEESLHRASFVGTPLIFQFDVIDRRRGTVASRSPVICETICIYLAADGWYMTNGATVTAVGAERVDQWFFDTLDMGRIDEVRGVWDAANRIAMWSFASRNCPDGVHDTILVYNYQTNKWAYTKTTCECLFEDYAHGMTLEDLDVYGSLEDVPYPSLDAYALQTGALGVSAFDGEHKIGRFAGDALEAVIETAEVGGTRMMLHGIRPLVDRGDAEACPVWRITQSAMPAQGAFRGQSRDGVCYQHLSTNYLRARVRIPTGQNWINAVGCELLTETEGGM